MSQRIRVGNVYTHDEHGEVVTTYHDHANDIWFREVVARDNAGVISAGEQIHQQPYDEFLGSVSMLDYPDNWDRLRKAILERDDYRCQACGKDVDASAPVHHICPLGAGGSNVKSNLITLCEEHHGLVHGGVT